MASPLCEEIEAIPLSIDKTIRDYKASLVKGVLPLSDVCPDCGAHGTLYLTRSRRFRWATYRDEESGEITSERMEVGLARCRGCNRRLRVLPAEFLPYKQTSLGLIEEGIRGYLQPEGSYRAVAGRLGCHHTTVWGWMGGMGAWALGRTKCGPHFTWSQLVTETEGRLGIAVRRAWMEPACVPASKSGDQPRHERLEAVRRLLHTADIAFPDKALPLVAWHRWAIGTDGVAGIGFPARFPCTTFQRAISGAFGHPSTEPIRKEAPWPEIPTPTTPPCGGTSRSPPSSTGP